MPSLTLPAKVLTRFLFERHGKMIASVQEQPMVGTVLMVCEEFEVQRGIMTTMHMILYAPEGGQATQVRDSRMEVRLLDELPSDSLFILDELP
ncbi:MAG TPA: hypothetical protein VF171_06690 [Trueperaceae bacterium]